jgi:uncharacterized membrane protein
VSDKRVERLLGKILRAGVLISALLVAAGGLVFLVRHGSEPFGARVFEAEPEWLRDPAGIVRATVALHGRAMIQLGLLILIATPVARVAMAAVSFSRERDYTYVVITLIVLSVLTYSFFAGQML